MAIRYESLRDAFLESTYETTSQASIDSVYNVVDTLMHMRALGTIDDMLDTIDLGRTSQNMMVAWLTVTLPVKSQLDNRAALFDKIRSKVGSKILEGLE